MTDASDSLRKNIEMLRESIKLIWLEVSRETDPARRSEMKRGIFEFYVPELKAAIELLEKEPNA